MQKPIIMETSAFSYLKDEMCVKHEGEADNLIRRGIARPATREEYVAYCEEADKEPLPGVMEYFGPPKADEETDEGADEEADEEAEHERLLERAQELEIPRATVMKTETLRERIAEAEAAEADDSE